VREAMKQGRSQSKPTKKFLEFFGKSLESSILISSITGATQNFNERQACVRTDFQRRRKKERKKGAGFGGFSIDFFDRWNYFFHPLSLSFLLLLPTFVFQWTT